MDRCTQCGTEIDQPERGRRRRYCSRSCQARAYRARAAAPPVARVARPRSLTSGRIATAAIALADHTGFAGLTMRRLATELGIATMSLYRHFSSRDALVVAMTDAVLDEVEPPGGHLADWRSRLEHEAREEWGLYRRHPWVLPAIASSRPPIGRGLLSAAERILTGIEQPGVGPERLLSVYLAVSGLVQGLALLPAAEETERAATGQTMEEWWSHRGEELADLLGDFPFLSEHFGPESMVVDFDALFDFALKTLLDGLETSVIPASTDNN
ncbi:TetR/AcrR family transcriptional regulator [Glycomyces luteolus]|uniref:TetR/AcrR family transcriptional regulator n=1 Tax=Glycomyces luteolus TaxID=2670330 RepID=A0A9X3PDS9_9ACTN|nr:TetR/AcrR family transcriptional regulator [Glycomyces luteolus]MDA1362176.1 TetR/AcrR family transcriptional regulator [Glycomyces luteolus]